MLEPDEQPLPYQFMHITDTYIDAKRESEWSFDYGRLTQASQLKEFLQDLPQLSPASRSVIITGDLVDHGSPDEFVELRDAVADAPVAVNLVPGNHDHMHTGLKGLVSRNNYIINDGNPELYEAMVGPRWFSYDVAGLHVVVMDWHTHELGLDHTAQEEWIHSRVGVWALPGKIHWFSGPEGRRAGTAQPRPIRYRQRRRLRVHRRRVLSGYCPEDRLRAAGAQHIITDYEGMDGALHARSSAAT